ncbi:unnamed protein product [Ixodes hexagonus]
MKKKHRKPGTQYCCVVGCNNNLRTSKDQCPPLQLYRFPGKYYEADRRQAWIRAVRRQKQDGSPWIPSTSARVCSAHFVGNCKSESQAHPSYVPSIFPAIYRKKASNAKRVRKRPGQCPPARLAPVEAPTAPGIVPETVMSSEERTVEGNKLSSGWDSLHVLVSVAAEATPTTHRSTVASYFGGTQCDQALLSGGPLRVLMSATDSKHGSTQVTHAEQADQVNPVLI